MKKLNLLPLLALTLPLLLPGQARATARATGGTYTEVGDYSIHKFTSSGTFTPSQALSVEYLIVGGGGGGGSSRGGGGGGGGVLYRTSQSVSAQGYSIVVGGGGGAAAAGGNSSAFGLTATGGGGGGTHWTANVGGSGGSGGGAAMNYFTNLWSGGTGVSGQGYNGATSGTNRADDPRNTGGGGGAGAAGTPGASTTVDPNGGIGKAYSISGSSVYYAGGGGGSRGGTDRSSAGAGIGGAGGGGTGGGDRTQTVGVNGLGGGGGGSEGTGSLGGSGVVIIRYILLPSAPTIGTPTALSTTSIRWNFTDNASNETGFKVYDTSNVLKATCASANRTYCDETGLSAGTSYTRKVVAYSASGNSSYSSTATISTQSIPTAPTIGTPTALSTTSIRWNFTDTANNETGFKVYDENNVLRVTCASANRTYCDETGLSAGTFYVRMVVAYNSVGNSGFSSPTTKYTSTSSCRPLPSDSTHTITANCSFSSLVTDSSNGSRYLTGITAGTSTDNTSNLTIASGTLTVLSNQTLAAGSINLTGGSIAISDGGVIELDKPIWLVDGDADGFPTNTTGYLQTSAPTNGRRLNQMTALSSDCADNSYNTTGVCCTVSTYYADADGDGYGAGAGTSICATAGYVTNNTDCNDSSISIFRTVSGYLDGDGDGYGSGALTTCTGATGSYVANNTDCYDANANAKPGSTVCATTHRGDGSFDYNCSNTQTTCGSAYSYSCSSAITRVGTYCKDTLNNGYQCVWNEPSVYAAISTACGASACRCTATADKGNCYTDPCRTVATGTYYCSAVAAGTQACQ